MKRNFLLLIAMCMISTIAMAQGAIHGVGGYYNYTATQMKASGQFAVGGTNGTKFAQWKPEVTYTDDMQYLKFYMGVHDTALKEGGFHRRSNLNFNEAAAGEGCMRVTRDYPIVAFKVSIPKNNYAKMMGYMEPEFHWYNPSTGANEKLPLSGLDGNGRKRFLQFYPHLKAEDGTDSVQLNQENKGKEAWRTGNFIHTSVKDTAWYVRNISPVDGELTEFIIAMNFGAIGNTTDGAVLDTTDIKLAYVGTSWLNVYCDTAQRDTLDTGEIQVRTLSRDEQALVYWKWFKTFRSYDELLSLMNPEGNWGDGAYVDPNKEVLNSTLYAMRKVIDNYKFSDKLEPLQIAYDNASAVYNNASSTADDYKVASEALLEARDAFLAAIAYDTTTKMVNFFNLSGLPLALGAENVTVGNYTGKPVVFGMDVPQDFLLTPYGTANGQKAYSIKTAEGTLVQATDGQLLIVPASQLASSTSAAQVVLGNRGTEDSPGYDFRIGKYYYFFDENTGLLNHTEEIPTVESYDEIAVYLFFPTDAPEYDPSNHDDINYPMTSGEGSFSEFNNGVVNSLEYAFEYSFATFPWDADAKLVAEQRATQPTMDDWRTNGFRVNTNIQEAEIDGLKLMRLNKLDQYYDIHADTLCQTLVNTDYSSDGIYTLMREHGAYTSAANRVPQPNQQCDSLFAVNLNSGINRYFAIKWAGTNDQITVGGFTFYIRKSIEETVLNPNNVLERRGDVYIWDLLECGIPYGDRKACAQYLSFNNIKNSSDAVYVDWIRFYNNLDEIPSETINVPKGKKGDANEDGAVDVSDITTIAAYILGQNPSPFNAGNADVNSDNSIDVSDITATAGIILGTN